MPAKAKRPLKRKATKRKRAMTPVDVATHLPAAKADPEPVAWFAHERVDQLTNRVAALETRVIELEQRSHPSIPVRLETLERTALTHTTVQNELCDTVANLTATEKPADGLRVERLESDVEQLRNELRDTADVGANLEARLNNAKNEFASKADQQAIASNFRTIIAGMHVQHLELRDLANKQLDLLTRLAGTGAEGKRG